MAARGEAQADVEVSTLVVPAWRLRWRAPELALVLGERAVALASTRRDEVDRLRAEALVVFASNRMGRGVRIADRALDALKAAEAASERETAWRLRVELADSARSVGAPLTGFAAVRPVLEADDVPPGLRATALVQAAECLVSVGRGAALAQALDEADHLYQADPLLDHDTTLLHRGLLRASAAGQHRRWGDLRAAVAAARDGLALLDRLKDAASDNGQVRGRLTVELVCALMDLNKPGEASEVGTPLLERPVRAPSASTAGWLRLALATRVHLPAGRVDQARDLLRDAADSAERHQLDILLAESLLALAHVHEVAGDLAEALANLRSAHAAERRRARAVYAVRARLAAEFAGVHRRPAGGLHDELAALLRTETPAPAAAPPTDPNLAPEVKQQLRQWRPVQMHRAEGVRVKRRRAAEDMTVEGISAARAHAADRWRLVQPFGETEGDPEPGGRRRAPDPGTGPTQGRPAHARSGQARPTNPATTTPQPTAANDPATPGPANPAATPQPPAAAASDPGIPGLAASSPDPATDFAPPAGASGSGVAGVAAGSGDSAGVFPSSAGASGSGVAGVAAGSGDSATAFPSSAGASDSGVAGVAAGSGDSAGAFPSPAGAGDAGVPGVAAGSGDSATAFPSPAGASDSGAPGFAADSATNFPSSGVVSDLGTPGLAAGSVESVTGVRSSAASANDSGTPGLAESSTDSATASPSAAAPMSDPAVPRAATGSQPPTAAAGDPVVPGLVTGSSDFATASESSAASVSGPGTLRSDTDTDTGTGSAPTSHFAATSWPDQTTSDEHPGTLPSSLQADTTAGSARSAGGGSAEVASGGGLSGFPGGSAGSHASSSEAPASIPGEAEVPVVPGEGGERSVPAAGLIAAAGAVRSGRRRAREAAEEEGERASGDSEANVLDALKAAGLLDPQRAGGRRRARDADVEAPRSRPQEDEKTDRDAVQAVDEAEQEAGRAVREAEKAEQEGVEPERDGGVEPMPVQWRVEPPARLRGESPPPPVDMFDSPTMVQPAVRDDVPPVGLGAAFVKGPLIPTARVPDPPDYPLPPVPDFGMAPQPQPQPEPAPEPDHVPEQPTSAEETRADVEPRPVFPVTDVDAPSTDLSMPQPDQAPPVPDPVPADSSPSARFGSTGFLSAADVEHDDTPPTPEPATEPPKEPFVTAVVVGGKTIDLPAIVEPTPPTSDSPSATRASRRHKSDLSLAELLAEALVAYEDARREDEAAGRVEVDEDTVPIPPVGNPPPAADTETTAPIQRVDPPRRFDTWTLPEP
ncbi:hypothetical protein LZG04_01655 [Saccharothrix sp. S26]|uniref:hypothetical protein n=1 Tax=Saccharothrix sp. S26 TaxID=2907215 RepID=UPI001F1C84B7|nr:hypothetical protein [Saccharothrix sp. S26]MCE6993518.1 hypothetical protein [Saccharothrix sp. S26]